ncbi:hypothetical protein, variant 2 [Aphanomyces invadans]|uniref:Uncharacterized protein n=1 Tax=Aphanomyces invadans TaxID=157072 RepID=A0A024TGC5_9STRA|nr:hypothetical protein, variant 2 [Aphanomyces invadans]ETV93098.1 hypothetical protein, variant 2 [Aphanomyces invadans]|eukprot:XP_008878362.1 hypothetical protein, variant 2 [Aphanomyces invadans]
MNSKSEVISILSPSHCQAASTSSKRGDSSSHRVWCGATRRGKNWQNMMESALTTTGSINTACTRCSAVAHATHAHESLPTRQHERCTQRMLRGRGRPTTRADTVHSDFHANFSTSTKTRVHFVASSLYAVKLARLNPMHMCDNAKNDTTFAVPVWDAPGCRRLHVR